jgi:hypothetical protein
MSSVFKLVIPSEVFNSAPPAFIFSILSIFQKRKQKFVLNLDNNPDGSKEYSAELEKSIVYVKEGIIDFINMDEFSKYTYLVKCKSLIFTSYCDYCYKKFPKEILSLFHHFFYLFIYIIMYLLKSERKREMKEKKKKNRHRHRKITPWFHRCRHSCHLMSATKK